MEKLSVSVLVDGAVSDAKSVRFGIREVQGDLNEKGYRQFKINRKNILIRGGGWAPDIFYREPRERIRQELEYVKHMNLNAIRLEGKLGSEDMFDIADEEGILIMAGWCCCDHWEHWDKWTTKDHEIANASLRSQISRLRSHPSVFVWLNGSDGPPPAQVENDYISILKERDWTNPFVSSASATPTTVTGASGVKMSGPYDYVPPEYWYLDKNKFGGAYGFNTETGPGPAVPTAQSIRRTLPKESWWPMDEQWNFHAGLGKFAQYNIFNGAMANTYGPATGLDDYSRRAQLMNYDGERAMFEAYAANKYTSTGVIQWMLNNAWPSFIWHLYDYYLVPGGGYFGTRKANEPVHVQYKYDDRAVVVVNSTLAARSGLRVSARVVDTKGKQLFTEESAVELAPDGVASVFVLPQQDSTTFAQLQLRDAHGALVSENFYWLPSKLAQLDWDKSNYFYTPATAYADMRDLADLPAAKVSASARRSKNAHEVSVTLKNPGQSVAFFLRCRAVKRGTEEELVPVFWSDNFVSLLPGEAKVLTVHSESLSAGDVEIKIDGWNTDPETLRIAAPVATEGNARTQEK